MSVALDYEQARSVLLAAIEWAESTRPVPEEWLTYAERVARAPSRTFTAALGTALLAKATDEGVDPLALKITDDPRSYSARSLCHKVLVPASVEHRFDLGATGREPLNNQPFFRYDRIDDMERVHTGARVAHRDLVETLQLVDALSCTHASGALAAFLRTRREAALREAIDLRGVALGVGDLIAVAREFVIERPEGGRRGQALVAACFDLAFDSVRMGRVHDPSRRYPGDVQVVIGARIVLAAEVRQKTVSDTDLAQFGAALRAGGTANGLVVALHPDQARLDRDEAADRAEEEHGVGLALIDSVEELISAALVWCGRPLDQALAKLPDRVLQRLIEIEISAEGLQRWKEMVEKD